MRVPTVKGYEWALTGEPTTRWQGRALASITDRDLIKAIDAYETKRQFASARLLRAYLHRFFRWAVEKRLIDRNPAGNIPLASAPSYFNRERVLTITMTLNAMPATTGLAAKETARYNLPTMV